MKINLLKMLSQGGINMYKLKGEKEHLLLVCFTNKDGRVLSYEVPILNKIAYIDVEEKITIGEKSIDAGELIKSIIEEIVKNKCFSDPNINGAKAKYKTVPAFEKVILSDVSAKGLLKSPKADAILEEKGFVFEEKTFSCTLKERDYSELLTKDPTAAALLKENRAELAKVGATFESLNGEIKIAYRGIRRGNCLGLIFAGPTGTGKSWAARILADKMNAPCQTIQIERGTTVDTLIGSFIPKTGETVSQETSEKILELIRDPKLSVPEALNKVQDLIKSKGESNKWVFKPGLLLKSYCEGWILTIEEVNFGDPGVLAVLNQFLDGTLRVTVNGEAYSRHPNFLVFMTMNPGYDGTDPLNVALKNRFAKINIPALTKEQFCERSVGYSKGLGHALPTEFFAKLFDFATKIEILGNGNTFHENVKFSIRNAQRLCDLILSEKTSFEEFSKAIAVQYLNDLTLDNDNSEAVEKLKTDTNIINEITQIYDLYDYADISMAEGMVSLDSFFTIEETEEKDEDHDLRDDDLDELMK